jgi:hypothetical protein
MPVNVLGRGTVVPRGGLLDGEAEAKAARAALATARTDLAKIDAVVAPSRELAAEVAAALGIAHASTVGSSGAETIEVAAALVDKTPGRIVLAVEGIVGQGAADLRGAVAAVLTKAEPAALRTTTIRVPAGAEDDEEQPVMSWRPTAPTSQER